ncbi:hypothetical protein EJ02DRAFT_456821, partial [Clathrospora elynae]
NVSEIKLQKSNLNVRRRCSCLQGRLPSGCGGDDGEVDSNNTNFSPLHPPEPSGHIPAWQSAFLSQATSAWLRLTTEDDDRRSRTLSLCGFFQK